jgi:hypothetical protein
METLGFSEHAHAAIHSVHLHWVSWFSYRPYTRVAEAKKPGQNGSSAVGDADSPATRTAKQFDVFLLILLPSPREDDSTSPPSLDATSLHCPQ